MVGEVDDLVRRKERRASDFAQIYNILKALTERVRERTIYPAFICSDKASILHGKWMLAHQDENGSKGPGSGW